MSARGKAYLADLGGSFTEDAPRPPVPGEEGELASTDSRQLNHSYYPIKNDGLKSEASTATPRRPDLDLGYEPEGSASPTPPYLKWAESLHSLLDDQDGINLFRTFLKQEECPDLLDFWFACSGFRKLEPNDSNEEKRLKLAKAIYKKYILDNNCIVSRQIKLATKCFIKDCVMKQQIDPAMFDQAQTEIQTMMEENTYPLFLKSDIYLEYTRTGGESPKLFSDQSSGSGTGKALLGYLPTLNEDEEWKCDQDTDEQKGRDLATVNRVTQKLLMETAPQRAGPTRRFDETRDYRHGSWREPVNPYYVNTGYALAPATSANDSEQQSMSSDADTMSLTDSSVDGIPPYRIRKQHRREMHESAKANGRVPLPHIPRTYRMPKDIHVEPEKFAAALISRLESVLREREAEEKLEERLKRVRAEEEGEDADVSSGPSVTHKLPSAQTMHHFNARHSEMGCSGLQMHDAHEENPESILDEHVQRVMKTPGCQSPGPGRHSPKSRSPDGLSSGKAAGLTGTLLPSGHKHVSKTGVKVEAPNMYHHKHVYHHIHHYNGLKPKEQIEAEATQRVQSNFWSAEPHHYATKSRNYAESTSMVPNPVESLNYGSKVNTVSKRNTKKIDPGKAETGNYETAAPPEDMERNQKILQWIIEGEKEIHRHKKTPHNLLGAKKPSHDTTRPSSIERPGAVHPWVSAQLRNPVQPSHPFIQDPTMPPNPAPNPLTQLEEARRRLEEEEKKSAKLQSKQRYYFKKVSDEFDCGVVFEEVRDEEAILPIFEEKIIGKVEKID
ncbi:axin-1 isoform X2 [Narcine bancroftii]|uniref:axin-1 isoform X2 n=1 Tax=Narcine bancroftii TaxID=1343680 RepID=UPI00383151FC